MRRVVKLCFAYIKGGRILRDFNRLMSFSRLSRSTKKIVTVQKYILYTCMLHDTFPLFSLFKLLIRNND
jgi:hypothetical protein